MKNSTIYLSILIFILSVSFTACSTTSSKTPGKAVITLYETIKNKEFDKTAKMYVTKEGEKLSEDELKKIEGFMGMSSKEFEKQDGIDKVVVNEETVSEDGNSAKVKYTVFYNNGETDDESISLIKVQGDWLFQITNF